jgi:uncharacterized protein
VRNDVLQGRHALVKGAPSGLGADFARELAGPGAGLTLVARREDQLRTLERELAGRHRVRVEVVVLDLTAAGAPDELLAATAGTGRPVDVLGQQRRLRPLRRVQQAGLGAPAQHARARRDRPDPPDQAVTARHAGTRLRLRLNIASVGAYQPSPTYPSYSAAKSFILNFTRPSPMSCAAAGCGPRRCPPGSWPPSSSRSPARRPPATSG